MALVEPLLLGAIWKVIASIAYYIGMQPNLFIAGVPKAATTSLADVFRLNEEIFVPEHKEPHFFSFNNRAVNFKGPGDREILEKMIVRNYEKYCDLYKGEVKRWSVDASTMYLYIPGSIESILRSNKDAKFILMFRDPADRAFSAFQHMRRDAREPFSSFSDSIADEPRRISDGWSPIWHYISASRYGEQMRRFSSLVAPENYLVLHQEWIFSNPKLFEKKISDFLGISFDVELLRRQKSNASGEPKSALLAKFLSRPNFIKDAGKLILRGGAGKKIKHWLRAMNMQEKTEFPEGVRENIYSLLEDDMRNFALFNNYKEAPSWLLRYFS